jgi:hypothetical protein
VGPGALLTVHAELKFPSNRYVGELISDAEADVREDDSYLFDLDNKVGCSTSALNYQRLLCAATCNIWDWKPGWRDWVSLQEH